MGSRVTVAVGTRGGLSPAHVSERSCQQALNSNDDVALGSLGKT
ncbi:hypothetical protein I305_04708 [Cryptococcus gattii E566]|uniref:Uncharacterized protein n=2 Tax=Cryptococcus gattii TaxID=37769 RepID=E6RF46_CRYGW|nr:Hypothetical Protein CGB_M1120C [Cryptococcus gattii WM276]ADV25499.1 Hypothetical Protein CGB_M1120C [Cryptococcus gattii WM276]KIR78857.1 hypothetical protein I306_04067 [Cryptococcus gattii EJB2]KIY32955.1 hypothetical protein I305_04708 [Cryptococcus gattii E566]KJE04981.1 hypothetical protein I311_01074 [Cryptococcus gattii NT-10]